MKPANPGFERAQRKVGNNAGAEPLLAKLPAARVKLVRQVLAGPDSPAKKRLADLLASPDFIKLDEDARRKTLAKLDLRAK